MPNRFHSGEIAVQQHAGVFEPADLHDNGIADTIDSRQEQFLKERTWAVIGASDASGNLWASLLHGPVGFFSSRDRQVLEVQARPIASDPLASAFDQETDAGLLILDLATRRRLRLNGRARVNGQGGLLIATREIYGNCPKYIQRRESIGVASAQPGTARRVSVLLPDSRRLVEQADTFFIATTNSDAGADCSHRGGTPGFIRVLDERHIAFPDYSGNNMFQTLGNLQTDSRVGLLVLNFETGDTLQLTGKAEIYWDSNRLTGWPGALRIVEVELQLVIETPCGFPLHWRLVEMSPFNPPRADSAR